MLKTYTGRYLIKFSLASSTVSSVKLTKNEHFNITHGIYLIKFVSCSKFHLNQRRAVIEAKNSENLLHFRGFL